MNRSWLWALWKMARPTHLALIALVYASGVGMAAATHGSLDFDIVLAGLLPLLPIAASVHYVNEFADVETDARTSRTPFSGGSGALSQTGLSPRIALVGGVSSLGVGVIVVWLVHPLPETALLLLGGIGVLGWQYSFWPAKLAWRGFGELTNAIIGGILLPLYGYTLLTGAIPIAAVVWVTPFGVLVFLNLLATQWPDRAADSAVGKRTLAVRWPPVRLRRTYRGGVLVWGASVILAGTLGLPALVLAMYLPALPLVVVGRRWFTVRERPLPSVLAMVVTAVTTTTGWWWLALH